VNGARAAKALTIDPKLGEANFDLAGALLEKGDTTFLMSSFACRWRAADRAGQEGQSSLLNEKARNYLAGRAVRRDAGT
jgi:hypothetical protein